MYCYTTKQQHQQNTTNNNNDMFHFQAALALGEVDCLLHWLQGWYFCSPGMMLSGNWFLWLPVASLRCFSTEGTFVLFLTAPEVECTLLFSSPASVARVSFLKKYLLSCRTGVSSSLVQVSGQAGLQTSLPCSVGWIKLLKNICSSFRGYLSSIWFKP